MQTEHTRRYTLFDLFYSKTFDVRQQALYSFQNNNWLIDETFQPTNIISADCVER
jgi:hypothetical protein